MLNGLDTALQSTQIQRYWESSNRPDKVITTEISFVDFFTMLQLLHILHGLKARGNNRSIQK